MGILGGLLGLLVGLSLGLLGGGGSILAVPIFVYVLGMEAKVAIAGSLAVVGLTALVGAARHRGDGQVEVRTAVTFGVVAMVGAYGGARLAAFVSGTFQLLLFAVVMLVAALLMFRRRPEPVGRGEERGAALAVPLVSLSALGVGALTGLVGVGGGFLIVPALVLLLRLPMKKAVGTSLLVIAMNAGAGFTGYATRLDLPWLLLGLFTACSVAGIFLGVHLVRYVPQARLRQGFAVFLVGVAVLMMWQNRSALGVGAVTGDPVPEQLIGRR